MRAEIQSPKATRNLRKIGEQPYRSNEIDSPHSITKIPRAETSDNLNNYRADHNHEKKSSTQRPFCNPCKRIRRMNISPVMHTVKVILASSSRFWKLGLGYACRCLRAIRSPPSTPIELPLPHAPRPTE